jgi:tyrosinase
MSRFIITGATGGATQGAVAPNRIEIRDFVKIEDQFSLYIQALQIMETTPQPNLTSHFQISGIHGLPYVSWDGAGDNVSDSDQWGGYCTHGSVLFPTWHRPYIALYEQVLQKHATDIAAKYTVNKDRYQKAAANLRAPYWDYSSPGKAVPPEEVISLQQVTITGPDGKRVAVNNPLLRYRFNPVDPSFPAPFRNFPATIRRPTSSNSNATDNIPQLRSILQSAQSDLTSKTYRLLTQVRTWPAFSNHSVGDGGSTSNSLEAIHDGVHVDVGGGGHMASPDVAGFDPIFYLHHANVDRLLSIWSALNPTVWVTRSTQEGGTFAMPPNAPIDAASALTPFWNAQTSFWASSGVADTSKLGYTYPEFNGLDMGNRTQVRAAIAQTVNKLYGGAGRFPGIFASVGAPASVPAASQGKATPPAPTSDQGAAAPHAQAFFAAFKPPAAAPSPGHPDASPSVWDWTARIVVKKFAVGGSFAVLLFLGEVPEDYTQWRTSPNYVGAHYAFVNSSAHKCANCLGQKDMVIEGFVHLNDGIAKHSRLNSFDPKVVTKYLTDNLHWRVVEADGTPFDTADMPSLEVTVAEAPLSMPEGEHFPVKGNVTFHQGITRGRTSVAA